MLDVTLIGCGATMPLPGRATAACAIQYRGKTVLLDCGEGTQAAARKAGISLVKIEAICLTHYHGDHILGLPGLLQTMASQGRTAPVLLTGPAQDYEKITSLLLGLAGELPFEIIKRPLQLPRDEQALWCGLKFKSQLLNHRAPCTGYRFILPRAGRFLREKAVELGVEQSKWADLQKGLSVKAKDGSVIRPEQVLGSERQGLTVVYATDTAPCDTLPELAEKADLLICDATYGSDEYLDRAELYGHSTFSQCGRLAQAAGAKRLWLTHYGGALTDPQAELHWAQKFFPAVEAGWDGKQIKLNFENNG